MNVFLYEIVNSVDFLASNITHGKRHVPLYCAVLTGK